MKKYYPIFFMQKNCYIFLNGNKINFILIILILQNNYK